ncbi:MAG: hypothetical protein HUJ68_03915, partial [Clostridia bacterium]|nr:hypothetical protein [Clostridia bacterium]
MKIKSSVIIAISCLIIISCSTFKIGNNWINSNIEGHYCDEKPSLKDDFYQSVNYEKLTNSEFSSNSHLAGIQNNMTLLLNKQIPELQNATVPFDVETDKFIKLYKKCNDWNSRNKEGLNPIIPLIKKINSIQSIKDFNSFFENESLKLIFPLRINMKSNNGYFYVPLIEINYLFDKYPNECKSFCSVMFQKLGYSEKETSELLEKAYCFEKSFNTKQNLNYENQNVNITKQRIKTEFANLPLFEYIESFGLPGNTFCISNMNVLKILDLNFTEDNLEAIKVL